MRRQARDIDDAYVMTGYRLTMVIRRRQCAGPAIAARAGIAPAQAYHRRCCYGGTPDDAGRLRRESRAGDAACAGDAESPSSATHWPPTHRRCFIALWLAGGADGAVQEKYALVEALDAIF